jgi:DNA-binding NtrC family response regulator
MARIHLDIADPRTRLTLKTILQAEGYVVADEQPDIAVCDKPERAVLCAKARPTLVIAGAAGIAAAVDAMKRGVYGYIFVPFQPGEPGLMVRRALDTGKLSQPEAETAMPIRDAEKDLILATLRRCKNNQTQAAKLLGIGRNTLWRKLKKIR